MSGAARTTFASGIVVVPFTQASKSRPAGAASAATKPSSADEGDGAWERRKGMEQNECDELRDGRM